MSQLHIFPKKNKTCSICGINPQSKGNKGILWNGFRDNDLGVLVCFSCQEEHYKRKSQTEHKGKYSEFPVLF